MVDIAEKWIEIVGFFFIALGFIIAILMQYQIFLFIIMLLSGFLAAHIFYYNKARGAILPSILLIVGFLVGYLIGSFRANIIGLLLIFAVSFSISYYLHKEKYIVIFKSEKFLK